ncbi:MAG: hypothetical protein R2780_15135 [Crocinitomicaceae bacterium]|nr:hypothetical protein [Crocinitomicaceae bacterium]
MEQRDLIKEQIEQLGRVLGKILSDFLNLKSEGKTSQGIEVSNERFKEELDIDIDVLRNLGKDELKNYFLNKKFTAEHIEKLADYFFELGTTEENVKEHLSSQYLLRSIDFLDLADSVSNTFSFERMNKKDRIKKIIKHKGQ